MFFKGILSLIDKKDGMSLTEIMVGGAILAGVGLAGATMFKDQKKAQQRVDMNQKLIRFHQTLAKNLSQTQNCNATLKNFYNLAIPSTSVLPIYNCSTNCSVNDLESDANSVGRSLELYKDTPERYIDNTRTWKIDNVSIPLAATKTTTGTISLKIDYSMNPALGSQRVSRNVLLGVRFANGVFKECYDPQENSVNNLQNDLCKTATSISSSGSVVALWNPVTQKCEFQNNIKNSCPPGEIVEGVRSDGSVHCRSATDGFDPGAPGVMNIDSTPTTCPAGTKANLIWNNSTKTMRVQCS